MTKLEDYSNLNKEITKTEYDMVARFKIMENVLENESKPHLFFQIVKNFFFAISAQDPSPFHFDIARIALTKMYEQALDDINAVDLLARAFLEICNKIYKRLKLPTSLEKTIIECRGIDEHEKVSYYIDFAEFPKANMEFEKQFFEENGLSIWDNIYLKILESTGSTGRKHSKKLKQEFKKKEDSWDRSFWFRNPEKGTKDYFFHSPAFIILACVLWEDDVKKRINFANKNVPALTKSINEPIIKILSPLNKVIENKKNSELQIFHQESLIGIIPMPAVPQKFINSVFNGVQKLNTVTGHRFTRLLVISAYNQMINGSNDYRVLRFDRGATDIAELLNLNGKMHITNIKEIVHAMAFCEFRTRYMAGNLIQLSKYKSPTTGREDEGYLITIGTQLLPYQAFHANMKGECNLLIPLLKDPPLIGSRQSHAGQYLLQMKIMEEFSNQSVKLFQEGVIEINEKQWKEIARSCGLTLDALPKIKDRWTRDGDDGAKLLERVEDDFYTLGKEHQKALIFLKEQGERRIAQSIRGKTSVIKKLKAKQRKK